MHGHKENEQTEHYSVPSRVQKYVDPKTFQVTINGALVGSLSYVLGQSALLVASMPPSLMTLTSVTIARCSCQQIISGNVETVQQLSAGRHVSPSLKR